MTNPQVPPDGLGDNPLEALARLLEDALNLSSDAAGARVEITLPDGITKLILGISPRPNGPMRLYIGALLPPEGLMPARRLSQAFGGGSVVRIDGRKELHQLSPYGPADMARTPEQATDWFAAKITAAWDAADEQSVTPLAGEPPVRKEPGSDVPALRQRITVLEGESAVLRAKLMKQTQMLSSVAAVDQIAQLRSEKLALETQVTELRAQLARQISTISVKDSSGRLAELHAENAALRRDRDVHQQLVEEGDKEAAELKAALGKSQTLEDSSARRAAHAEAEVTRISDELKAAKRPVASTSGTEMSREVADGIVEMLRLALQERAASATTVALLERARSLVPRDSRVAGWLAEHYLRMDRPHDAIHVLSALGAEALSPVSAAVLAEAHLSLRQVPPDGVLERADWRSSKAAELLREATAWLSPKAAVGMSFALAANPPAGLADWFVQLNHWLPDSHLAALHEVWSLHDPDSAAHALMRWIEASKVPRDAAWIVTALRTAVDVEDQKDAVRAVEYLLGTARRTVDPDLLEQVSSAARRRLHGADRTRVLVDLARAAEDMGRGVVPTERDASFLVDVYWQVRGEKADDNLRAVNALVERMYVNADATVRQLLDPCRRREAGQSAFDSIEAVSSVSDALHAVESKSRGGLLVLKEARESAAQRQIGYKKALSSLIALAKLAERFASDELQEPIREACRRLPGYKEDISDSAKQVYGKHYERRLPDGRMVLLGPHINAGGKDGRIYFHIDDDPRQIVVGHVGHLPGQRDT